METEKQDIIWWGNRWAQGRSGWHMKQFHPELLKNFELFTGQKINIETGEALSDNYIRKSVFIPLCGKTKDIRLFLNLGYRVFGVEGVEAVVEQLNAEESLGMQRKELDNDSSCVYATPKDGPYALTIYCGDILKCPIENWGPFDLIWDRGSLIAVDYDDRREYIEILKRSVRLQSGEYGDFRYLLETVNYDKSMYPGPPRAVDDLDMQSLYGDWTQYKFLSSAPLPECHQIRKHTCNFIAMGELRMMKNYLKRSLQLYKPKKDRFMTAFPSW